MSIARNAIVQFLYQITDPVLIPVQRVIPPMGGFDISPLVVLIGLRLLSSALINMARGM